MPVWMDGEEKRVKFGYWRNTEEMRDVTDLVCLAIDSAVRKSLQTHCIQMRLEGPDLA